MILQRIIFVFSKLTLLFFLTFLVFPVAVFAQSVDVDEAYYSLVESLEYYVDEDQRLTIEQLNENIFAVDFVRPKGAGHLQLKPNTVVWLKLQLKFSAEAQSQRYIISALGSGYKEIRIYRPLPEGGFKEFVTGDRHPARGRELQIPRYAFEVEPQGSSMLIYIRVLNNYNMHLMHWMLMGEAEFYKISKPYNTINFLIYGALIGVVLFGFGIGLTLKNRNYLYFSFYILAGTLTLLPYDGVGFYWLWPNHPEINKPILALLILSVFIGRLLTIYGFLETSKYAPTLAKLTRYWIALLVMCLIGVLFGLLQSISLKVLSAIWLISMVMGLVLNVAAIRYRASLAWPFFLILLLPITATCIQIASEAGWINIGASTILLNKVVFILHAFLFSTFIALNIKQVERSAHIAQHDHLTGLENFEMLTMRFKKTIAIAQRYRWQVLVMFVDLNKFKPVNDIYGHEVGDQLLKKVASRITKSVANVDLVSRVGGDEFLVVQAEYKEAMNIHAKAEKIIDEVSKPFIINGHKITIGASIGIARYPHHGTSLDELKNAADKAMYEVKRSGNNGVAVYGYPLEWVGD